MNLEEIFKLFVPIAAGGVSAFLGAWFALRKFKKEKVWDEQRAGYKSVIESIEELIFWSEQIRASHCGEFTVVGEARFDESMRNLSKFGATGSLLFSPQFQDLLAKTNAQIGRLMFEINEESKPDSGSEREMADWHFLMANKVRSILEECLPKLIKIANDDRP